MSSVKFRKDVTGLRGVAVILVLLFHYQAPFFSNGYIGVDVFFVISGYVITLGTISRLENGQFSIMAFYISRFKRLFPALSLMVICTYFVSAFLYFPESFKSVGQFVVSTLFFLTNFLLYFKQRDYFGLENGENPLFHTWSLGVEWQFYFLFPFFFKLIFDPRKRVFFAKLVCTASFFFYILNYANQNAVFYLPIYRLWEIMVGVVLAFQERKGGAKYSLLLGFLLIVCGLIFNLGNKYLDFNVIAAVIGTIFIIRSNPVEFLSVRALQNYFITFVGLISYSLYLWHIPIYSLVGVLFSDETQLILTLIILLPVAILSYKFVESKGRLMSTRAITLLPLIVTAIIVAFLGFIGHLNGGYKERSQLFMNLSANNGFGLNCSDNSQNVSHCRSTPHPEIALLGNSYAMVFVSPLVKADYPVLQLTKDSCAIGYVDVVVDVNSNHSCANFYRDAVRTIVADPKIKVVILSSTFEKEMKNAHFKRSFRELLGHLENKQVIVIGPTPRSPFNVGNCILKNNFLGSPDDCSFRLSETHNKLITQIEKEIAKTQKNDFLDITPAICFNNECTMRLGSENAMYIDTGHLSFAGASIVLKRLEDNGFTIP